MDLDVAAGARTLDRERSLEDVDLFSETESIDDALLDEVLPSESESSESESSEGDSGNGASSGRYVAWVPGRNPQDAEGSCLEPERQRSPRPVVRFCVRPAETLILLDWDDTLMPSTWLSQSGLRLDAGAPTETQRAELTAAARAAARTVQAAKRLGTVVVITNAEWGWVELSCKHFLPTLWPLLENIKIRSARSFFEQRGSLAPALWKRVAFQQELRTFCQNCCKIAKNSVARVASSRLRNVISLGDSVNERDALRYITKDSADCWGKSVKLMEQPDMRVFAKEHRILCTVLRPIAKHPGTLDLSLQLG